MAIEKLNAGQVGHVCKAERHPVEARIGQMPLQRTIAGQQVMLSPGAEMNLSVRSGEIK